MGGRGSTSSSSEGELSTTSGFSKGVDKLYKSQKQVNWESDYIAGLPLRGYFGNAQSFQLNKYLRGEIKGTARLKDLAKNMDNGLKTSGIEFKKGTKVFRSVSGDFANKLTNLKTGSSITEKGWLSTSPVKAQTKRFGKTEMHITLKGSSKALVYKAESEILFKPGAKLTKKSQITRGGKTIINMELE